MVFLGVLYGKPLQCHPLRLGIPRLPRAGEGRGRGVTVGEGESGRLLGWDTGTSLVHINRY